MRALYPFLYHDYSESVFDIIIAQTHFLHYTFIMRSGRYARLVILPQSITRKLNSSMPNFSRLMLTLNLFCWGLTSDVEICGYRQRDM